MNSAANDIFEFLQSSQTQLFGSGTKQSIQEEARFRRQLNNYLNFIDSINSPDFADRIKDTLINDTDYNNNDTIFMRASKKYLTDIAFSLLRHNLVKLDHINKDGNTPLMLAIKNNVPELAIEIIKTGKSNPDYINQKTKRSAIDLAMEKNMTSVLNEIEAQKGLSAAAAVRLRTTPTDINNATENRKGYRDVEGNLNPSAPLDIEKNIKGFLGGKKSRRNKKNRKTKKIRRFKK